MKKLLLSLMSLLFSGVMLVALICPVASYQTKFEGSAEDSTKHAQSVTTLTFIKGLFATQDSTSDAAEAYTNKKAELLLKVGKDKDYTQKQKDEDLLNSNERALYETSILATSENLNASFGIVEGDMISKTKIVSSIALAYIICAGLVVLVSLLGIVSNSPKLRAFGTALTVLALLVSIAFVIVVSFVFNITSAGVVLYAKVHYFAYIILAYTFLYVIVRSIINKKLNKI